MEEINTFIQQGWIQLIKIDSKLIYIVLKDFYLKINAVLLNFLFIKILKSTKILGNTDFYIGSNKCFFSNKSAY